MDFKPALPRNNDNIFQDSPVKEALVLLSGVAAYFASHPECQACIAALKKTVKDLDFDIRAVKPLPGVL